MGNHSDGGVVSCLIVPKPGQLMSVGSTIAGYRLRMRGVYPDLARNGGARRDRTDDLLHAMQALFQLSYGPLKVSEGKKDRFSVRSTSI